LDREKKNNGKIEDLPIYCMHPPTTERFFQKSVRPRHGMSTVGVLD
jgi:hypothetical protein